MAETAETAELAEKAVFTIYHHVATNSTTYDAAMQQLIVANHAGTEFYLGMYRAYSQGNYYLGA